MKHERYGSDAWVHAETEVHTFAPVYYYLFAGIMLLVAVFLFLPRVSIG